MSAPDRLGLLGPSRRKEARSSATNPSVGVAVGAGSSAESASIPAVVRYAVRGAAFPGARGYSVSSLRYIRAFAAAWPERAMLQSGIAALPWAHVTLLLDKLPDGGTRDWYAERAGPDASNFMGM